MSAYSVSTECAAAQMERYPGSQGPRDATNTHGTTNFTHDIYWKGKTPGRWLPLHGQKTTEDRIFIWLFLGLRVEGGMEFSRAKLAV